MAGVETPQLPPGFESTAEEALGFAGSQVRRLVTTQPGSFPIYTVGGRWHVEEDAWTNWTEGFLGGLIWIIARRTGDAWWREQAEKYSLLIEPRKEDRTVHDLGFLFISTWKRWFEATGDPVKKDTVIHAGRTMALRFNEKGRYLRSFVSADSCFIDIMMNVGIIFYAAVETKDPALLKLAHQHCVTTRRTLVRGDGSTSHEGIFDLETGEFLRQTTQQGYRGDSSWSRGLAWSLYGFGTCYRLTRDPIYLQTAQLNAQYWLSHIPESGIAPWDFDAPEAGPLSRAQVDTSASAIAAVGLLNLAELTQDRPQQDAYRDCALRTIDSLAANYLGEGVDGWEGTLRGGVYHIHKQLGVRESVMWGEFFFVEALQLIIHRLRRLPR
jgi:unsaturated chondroitin disaccharide hydrolase